MSRINNPAVVAALPTIEGNADRIFAYLLEEKPVSAPKSETRVTPIDQAENPIAANSTFSGSAKLGSLDSLLKPPTPKLPDWITTAPTQSKLPDWITQSGAPAPAPTGNPTPQIEPVYTFLVNPSALKWSRKASYTDSVTAGTSVQAQSYYHSSGRSLKIDGLLLETWFAKKSLRPLLEKLQSLLVPDPENKVSIAPKVLTFVWGSQRFGPCVLTDISWTEKAWLGGEPATVDLSMSLEEIPPPDSDLASRLQREQKAKEGEESADKLKAPLTDRQKQEASQNAKDWLKTNNSKLPKDLQERIKSSRYATLTDPATGNVQMFDEKNTAIGIIGKWDGKTFDIKNQTLTPQKT